MKLMQWKGKTQRGWTFSVKRGGDFDKGRGLLKGGGGLGFYKVQENIGKFSSRVKFILVVIFYTNISDCDHVICNF